VQRAPDARPRAYADIDLAEIFGGGSDRVSEREKLDLDCGTQAAEFSGSQILGEGGYFVGTVRRNEEIIGAYIRNQEIEDKELDQLQLKLASS
jgi:hypothetical protein